MEAFCDGGYFTGKNFVFDHRYDIGFWSQSLFSECHCEWCIGLDVLDAECWNLTSIACMCSLNADWLCLVQTRRWWGLACYAVLLSMTTLFAVGAHYAECSSSFALPVRFVRLLIDMLGSFTVSNHVHRAIIDRILGTGQRLGDRSHDFGHMWKLFWGPCVHPGYCWSRAGGTQIYL